jgi:hypothetical protein
MTECNCTKYPFKPHDPCYSKCTGRILSYASPLDLKVIFEIPDDILDIIQGLKLENTAETLDDYMRELNANQSQVLNNIFAGLDQNLEAVNWLKTNMESRESLPA